jgi:hypothetical protein
MYWTAGAAIFILAITAGMRLFRVAPYQPLGQITSPTAAPNPHQKESESADHEDALLQDRRTIRTGNDQRGRDTVSQLPSGSRTERSVIGRPFAISELMQAELRKSDVFRPARERLEQLAREPRDDAWAKLAEFQVQDLIVADGNSIRNIECRTTVCAVEMVQVNALDIVTIEQQLKGLGLWGPESMTSANDTDGDGNKIQVTIFSILRR